MQLLSGLLAAISLLLATASAPLAAASAPAPHGHGGAVVSAERTATEIGIHILRAGGNAADAAVATALALAVVHPQAGNLGGGGFAVVRSGDQVTSLDFRETAPAAAHRDMFLDSEGRPRPQASLVGPLAAGVPGSPAGLYELHGRFGSLPWSRVVAPAERLAAGGFLVSRRLHADLTAGSALLRTFPESAAAWLPGGAPPAPGTRLRRPGLAATLAAYRELGPPAIMGGEIAAAVVAASERHGGILTAADLESYRPRWLEPLTFAAAGWRFAAMDLPSSGGFLVAATLAILERTGWQDRPRFGADRAHLLAESWRLVFADRVRLGDLGSTAVATRSLLAPERLKRQAKRIDRGAAARSIELAGGSETWSAEAPETTHLAVIDTRGMVVSLTTTLNDRFGCGLWVPEAGFFLNNEMDDFASAPGQPNLYGLVQGEANAVAPGRRMLSSMAPTVGWRGSELLAIGGRGGSRIPTAVTQVLLNLLVDGDALQKAVDRPRIHHQWLPDALNVEADALAPETRSVLAGRGHEITVATTGAKVNVARRLADGSLEAAADPRGPGAAAVVKPFDRLP